MPGLGKKSVNSIGWRSISLIVNLGLYLAATAVTARLLTPEEIGLCALVLLFIEPLTLIAQLGFPSSIVQAPAIDPPLIRCAFTFVTVVAFTLWIVSCLAAALLLDPALLGIFVAMTSTIIVAAASGISEGLLIRELEFQRLATAEFAGALIYALSAIGFGVLDFGVWCLALACILQALVKGGIFFAYRPQFPFAWGISSMRRFITYGALTTTSRCIYSVGRSLDSWIIANTLPSSALGLYSRAQRIARLPSELIIGTLGSVIFPGFSRVQSESDRLRAAYLFSTRAMAFITFPLAGFFFVNAREIVLVLLGHQWTDCIEPLQALIILGAMNALAKVDDDLLRSFGLMKLHNAIFAFYFFVALICVSLAVRHGITMVGYAASLACIVRYSILHLNAKKVVGFRWMESWCAVWPGLAALFITAGTGLLTRHFLLKLSLSSWGILIFEGIIFGLTWIAVFSAVPGRAFQQMRGFAFHHFGPLRFLMRPA